MTLNVTLPAFAAERRSAPASIGQYLLSAGRSASNPPVAVASVYRCTDNGRPTATQTLLRVLCSQRQKKTASRWDFPSLAWANSLQVKQEAPLSPSDRAMRLVSSNLANYYATVQKLLIRQVLTKPMSWSWRFSWKQCVINKPTTVELCISPVYRRLAVAKFSKSTM